MEDDNSALVTFTPDGSRADFLRARMIDNLAQSVEEILQGCSSHLGFGESIARLPLRIRASSRVAPELYCIYFDLLQAVRHDNLDACARLLGEMDTRMDAALPSFYSRWGTLPESTARRYLTYLNVDPTTRSISKRSPSLNSRMRGGLLRMHSRFLSAPRRKLRRRLLATH